MINWDGINKLSCIITIGLPIATFVTCLKFNKFKKWIEYKKIRKNVNKNSSAVLIVSVGKNDIENQVKVWLKQRENYNKIPDENILKVEKLVKIGPKDVDTIIEDLRSKKIKLQQKGITNVHLFVSAPVIIGEMVGAELSNNFNVYVYQYNFNSKNAYECFGKLQR